MKRSTAAVYNVNKISDYLNKLFNSTQKVNIGLMGDSTVLREGHGWDSGVVNALTSLGCRRFGTGVHGAAGQDGGAGFGSSEDDVTINACPCLSPTNNGFTASIPTEWHNLVTNWGDATGATTDAKRTNLGVLMPMVITASTVASNTNAFIIHGNSTLGHTRAFPGLTNDLIFNHWYAITNATLTGGGLAGVGVRKATDSTGVQTVFINNVNGASGGNFTFTMGLTTTGNIAYSATNTTLATNIVAAITGSFPSLTAGSLSCTVSSGTGLVSGDVAATLYFGAAFKAGIDMPLISVNTGTLTAQYQGTGYSAGQIFTETYAAGANKGGQSGFYPTLATFGGLSAGSQTINSRYVTRAQFVLGATTGRDYTTGFIPYNGGISGPWCSLFNSMTISGATNGYSCTPLLALGGRGARTHAVTLQNQNATFLKEVFLALAEHAGCTSPSDSPLLIRVCGGANDKSYEAGTTSVGPVGGLSSNAADGLQDNWQAMINRVHAIYDANNWSKNNLYWLFVASMESNVAGTDMSFARTAAQNIAAANDRTAAVNVYSLTEGFTADITGLQGRNSAGDTTIDYYHPSYYGYKVYSQVEWGSLLDANAAYLATTSVGSGTPCPASTNGIWFAGKVYTPEQFNRIIQSYYTR